MNQRVNVLVVNWNRGNLVNGTNPHVRMRVCRVVGIYGSCLMILNAPMLIVGTLAIGGGKGGGKAHPRGTRRGVLAQHRNKTKPVWEGGSWYGGHY